MHGYREIEIRRARPSQIVQDRNKLMFRFGKRIFSSKIGTSEELYSEARTKAIIQNQLRSEELVDIINIRV